MNDPLSLVSSVGAPSEDESDDPPLVPPVNTEPQESSADMGEERELSSVSDVGILVEPANRRRLSGRL